MGNYLEKYLYSYHWDPAIVILRSLEAKLISSWEFKEPILDLGCGDGIFSSILLPEHKIIGLDFKLKNTLKAKKRKFYSDLMVCDARRLGFKKKTFNTILMNCFIEHIVGTDLMDVLSEANRILKDRGRIYITLNSKTFGDSDPVIVFLKRIGCSALCALWEKYKNKRLALYSLKDYPYWDKLFKDTNFDIIDYRRYLPSDSEKRFFMWTELQYIGISRLNIGSVIRVISKILSYLGIDLHRKVIAKVFGKILMKDYASDSKTGSCMFFVLEKNNDVVPIQNTEGAVQRVVSVDNPSVSVIIPSLDGYRDGNLNKLVEDLKQQLFTNMEVIVVKGISPQGRAINIGVDRTKGDILIILDDDSRIDNLDVISNLTQAIQDESIGMVGASILPPPDANWLQKKSSKEFPRFGMQVVNKITESDMACHGCCAFRKDVFEKVGRERENILRGLDPDLRVRLRNAGYRVVLAPDSWVYHPLPGTLFKLMKAFFRNGMGSAYCLKYQPELIYDTDEILEAEGFKPKKTFIYRLMRFPIRLLKALIDLKVLRFIAYIIYAIGYYCGLIKYSISKKSII